MCTIKLEHKDKLVRCVFSVVPGGSPALLGMSHVEMLGILKMMCKLVEGQHVDKTFNSQTMKPSSDLSCKANTDWESRPDNLDAINTN